MKFWRAAFFVSVGWLLDEMFRFHSLDWRGSVVSLAALTGWGWFALAAGIRGVFCTLFFRVTGQPLPLRVTDPQALAAEIAALNAQISQLRDTATSFDVSFDETLHRMDERLRRVEQQSPFVQIRR